MIYKDLIPDDFDPGLGKGEFFDAFLEGGLNQVFQVFYVFNEAVLTDGFLDLLPDSFNRV